MTLINVYIMSFVKIWCFTCVVNISFFFPTVAGALQCLTCTDVLCSSTQSLPCNPDSMCVTASLLGKHPSLIACQQKVQRSVLLIKPVCDSRYQWSSVDAKLQGVRAVLAVPLKQWDIFSQLGHSKRSCIIWVLQHRQLQLGNFTWYRQAAHLGSESPKY